jgi:DNA primase
MSRSSLHPDTIQQIRQKADIVEVIADKVVLRKQGRNYVGLCPFHKDRKPSFQVSTGKQIYKCFACGAGGDVIRFLTEYEQIPFSEAVQQLARRYRIPIQESSPQQQQEYERRQTRQENLLQVLAMAADFYQHTLHSSLGTPARRYLEQRQIQPDIVRKFQLGFAPPGWEPLIDYLGKQKQQPMDLLEAAGLVSPRRHGGGWYDRFRHRLMFPICNGQGQVIGFAGRALGEEQPKYLNSPETELFNKSQILYGLNFARDTISQMDQVLVVEGYFDVLALHQAGIEQTVASMGTALGTEQVKALLRYTPSNRLILNFDADRAGITAAQRAIQAVEGPARRGEIELRILTIPAGKDADEFLRQHSALAFQELLDEAPFWLDWQLEQILAAKDLSNAMDYLKAQQAIVELLSGLTGEWRALYVYRAAEQLSRGRGNTVIARDIEQELRRRIRERRWSNSDQQKTAKGSKLLQSESHLLQIFLHFQEFRATIRQELIQRDLQFSFLPHRELWHRILELVVSEPALESRGDDLLNTLRAICAHDSQLNQRLSHLLWLDENTRVALMRPKIVVRAAIANMELEIRQKRYRYWTQLWDKAFSERETDLAQEYQACIQAEYQAIQALQKDAQLSYEDLLTTPLADDLI